MEWPREIEESFHQIEEQFNKKAIREFMMCEEKELCLYHFGMGTWIRNHLLLTTKGQSVV